MMGERLRGLRREKKMRQRELGKIIGVQETTISLYETGKNTPSDATKVNIARFFNISLDYLLGVIDDPVPYYTEDSFCRLPENISKEEKFLFSELKEYIRYRRQREKV